MEQQACPGCPACDDFTEVSARMVAIARILGDEFFPNPVEWRRIVEREFVAAIQFERYERQMEGEQ